MSKYVTVTDVTKVELDEPAGVVGYMAEVHWDTGDHQEDSTYLFMGNEHGAPGDVVTIVGGNPVPVINPERFGVRFNEDWIRNFYA